MNSAPAVTRISALTLLLALPVLAQRPAAADADAILERGREKALAYAKSLPDFVCTEIIQRYKLSRTAAILPTQSAASMAPSWAPIDRLTVRLSFFQQKEDHKLELVNDQPTTLPSAWFRDALPRIPSHSIPRLSDLLPHNWKPITCPAQL